MHLLQIQQGGLHAHRRKPVVVRGRLKEGKFEAHFSEVGKPDPPVGGKDHPGGLISESRETRRAEIGPKPDRAFKSSPRY